MPDQQQTQTPEATEQTPATPAVAENTETPAEHMIPKSRFDEVNEKLRKIEADAAKRTKEQQAEAEKQMAEQAQWQQLAEQRRTQLDELTPKAELADKLTAMVAAQYEATIKEWPQQVKQMAPPEDASILSKLDWMQKAEPLAQELLKDKQPAAGNGHRPPPISPAGASKATAEQRQQWNAQAARRYK